MGAARRLGRRELHDGTGSTPRKNGHVGDEKWRDDALAFTAKGFRPTAIEFFPTSRLSEARIWLDA